LVTGLITANIVTRKIARISVLPISATGLAI
jgi:hypothetical protein